MLQSVLPNFSALKRATHIQNGFVLNVFCFFGNCRSRLRRWANWKDQKGVRAAAAVISNQFLATAGCNQF